MIRIICLELVQMGYVGGVKVFESRWVQLGVFSQMPNEDAVRFSGDSRKKLEVEAFCPLLRAFTSPTRVFSFLFFSFSFHVI